MTSVRTRRSRRAPRDGARRRRPSDRRRRVRAPDTASGQWRAAATSAGQGPSDGPRPATGPTCPTPTRDLATSLETPSHPQLQLAHVADRGHLLERRSGESAPLPIVLLTLTTFARLNRLNAFEDQIDAVRGRERNARARSACRSVAVPHDRVRSSKHGIRAELRPTPAGRSFTVVSLLLSAPVTTLNGSAVPYE